MNEPLIFKTDINCYCQNCPVSRLLDAHPEIVKWSVDTEDVDCVLCVFGDVSPFEVISVLKKSGYECAEM